MINKAKVGQLWTDSVAYVALILGAGVSIAGNVADTFRTRGTATDGLDVFLAAFWPAVVVLTVHLFVNGRWIGLSWPMQVLRWLGCLSIGAMAMRVSWVHLNDLMVSRGQEPDVAVLGPLAIDALAIMATALILAGRGRPVVQDMPAPALDTPRDMSQNEVDEILERWTPAADVQASVADEARSWLDSLDDAAGDQEPTLPIPVSPSPSNTVKPESVPDSAVEMIQAWATAPRTDRPAAGQVDALVAAAHSRSTKTAQRWRAAVLAA